MPDRMPDSPSTAGPWAPDAAYRALALKMEVVSRLAGRIAHEFNTIRTLVRNPSLPVREFTAPGPPARETEKAVERALNRVAELTGRLLTFSRPAASAPAPAPLPAGGVTVLVAETEPHIRLLNQTILEKQGYRALLAESSRQAVEVYTRALWRIDLILLDLSIAVRRGGGPGAADEAGARVIEDLIALDPAVRIVLTSTSFADDLPARVRGHVRAFVPKPYRAEQLLDAVRAGLGAPQGTA